MRDMDIFKDIDQWYILQQGDENKSQCAGIILRVWQEEVDFYVFSSIING